MKKLIPSGLVAVLVLTLSLNACQFFINCEKGEGAVVEKEIQLENFDEVELQGAYKLIITQGENQRMSVKAQENLIDLLNTNVSRGKWSVYFDPCVESNKPIEIYLTTPSLKNIGISGSGEIIGDGTFKSNHLELNITGSGELRMDVDAKELYSEINGSGDIKLSGISKKHEIEINGSGDIDAYDLKSDNCEIEINGSGDVKVNVSYALDAEVNGSGDIYYKGNVKKVNSSINGSGNLNQAN